MNTELNQCVAVITGASSGIGRATALRFAREGATLVVTARREPELQSLVSECEGLGARAMEIPCDVSDEESVRLLAQAAIESHGRIDVWVNDAAVSALGRFEETPADVFRRIIDTNFFGYVNGMRAVLPHFRERGRGTLINVASIAGRTGQPYASAYAASKAAIISLTESVRMEHKQDSPEIHLCTIVPATIDTPLFQHAANFMGKMVKAMPPVYSPEDVAEAIVECARNPRDEVTIGNSAHLFRWMKKVAPSFFESMMALQVEKEHFAEQPSGDTAGNVFEPVPWGSGVTGGWSGEKVVEPAKAQKAAWSGAAVAAGAGLAAMAAWGLTHRRHR
jgi:NAD(P)-dependent dehydrogenase (short-subunit alcohol dehydrogenase family)